MKLLLISNSTNPGEAYLGWPREAIKTFLQKHQVKKVLFVPYAGVTISWDDYEKRVKEVYAELGCEVESIHHAADPVEAVLQAEAVAVGGGNTWQLVSLMQQQGIIRAIRDRARTGMPYMGWSAGSNVACPTLKTTNDMPITEPESFRCMELIPFQINPHYLDAHPEGHGGETREQRIEEFIEANQQTYVAGLREACYLLMEDGELTIQGRHPLRLFKYGEVAREIPAGANLNFLLTHGTLA